MARKPASLRLGRLAGALHTARGMHLLGLSSLLVSTALASAPTPGAASKAGVPSPSRSIGTELQLEVVERSGSASSSFGFVVPVDGSVAASIERTGDPQHCEVSVHPARAGLHLQLRCAGGSAHALHVEATRALTTGTRVRLAEVSHPGGARSQVFVTLR